MLRLALPVLAEQLLGMLVVYSDTLLTGRNFGQPELAAINLLSYLLWMLGSVWFLVSIGSTALVARFVGAGDSQAAVRTTNQSLLAGVALAAAVTCIGVLWTDDLVGLLQLEGDAAQRATRYLYFVVPIVPFMMLEVVGIACLRGAGDTVSGLVIMSIVNVTNICVSWPLALGWFGLPAWGWDAVALSTASGHLLGGCITLGLLVRGRSGLRISPRLLRPDASLLRRILRVGVPGGIDVITVIALHLWFVAIVNGLGVLEAAAHGIAIRIESLAYLPGVAFQIAAATLAGQYLGAGDRRGATRSGRTPVGTGGGIVFGAGLLVLLRPEAIASLFVSSEQRDVVTAAAPLLRIVSLAMPAFALQVILTGALRGAGDTRWPLVFTLIGCLGVRIPLAYLFTGWLDYGLPGAWYAMVLDIFVRCALVCLRFWRGRWQEIAV